MKRTLLSNVRRVAGLAISLLLFGSLGMLSHAEATSGEQVYKQSCMTCHGVDGKNGWANVLVGDEFITSYRTHGELYNKVSRTMPRGNAGSLSEEEYIAVVNYVLSLNGKSASIDQLKATPTPSPSRKPTATPKPTLTPTSPPTSTPSTTPSSTPSTMPLITSTDIPRPVTTDPVTTPAPTPYLPADDIATHPDLNAIVRAMSNQWMSMKVIAGKRLFQPDKSMSRAELLRVIITAKGIKPPTPKKSTYKDTSKHTDRVFIEYAYSQKWIGKMKDGQFKPNASISRADAAVVLKNAFGLKPVAPSTVKDIAKTDPRSGAIGALIQRGIMSGNSKKQFEPKRNFTRAETAVALDRMVQK